MPSCRLPLNVRGPSSTPALHVTAANRECLVTLLAHLLHHGRIVMCQEVTEVLFNLLVLQPLGDRGSLLCGLVHW
jgi:hypothetical protein